MSKCEYINIYIYIYIYIYIIVNIWIWYSVNMCKCWYVTYECVNRWYVNLWFCVCMCTYIHTVKRECANILICEFVNIRMSWYGDMWILYDISRHFSIQILHLCISQFRICELENSFAHTTFETTHFPYTATQRPTRRSRGPDSTHPNTRFQNRVLASGSLISEIPAQ